MNNDVDVDKPNNLLFANIDGEDQLVGVAYLFMDKVNTTKEIPFESELAAWHDHPQFAGQAKPYTCFMFGLLSLPTALLRA